jgi:4a-hydroxytetrahydrobiopterin dehydratase
MARLSQDVIDRELKSLPGWEFRDNSIGKLFQFKEFMDGIDFINRVARIAEAGDHHPDIHIGYTRVRLVCSTHTDGGVTEKDIKLAKEIEQECARN